MKSQATDRALDAALERGRAVECSSPAAGSALESFEMDSVVWCVFAEGVTPGVYSGSKTFKSETPGKADYVVHYVQTLGNKYAQGLDAKFIHREFRAAREHYRTAARAMIKQLKREAGL